MFKSDFKLQLNLKPVKDFTESAALAADIRIAQEVANEAKEGSPVDTGTNKRSIGWAVAKGGVYGTLQGSETKASADDVPYDPDYKVIVGTSSGYGGYLETGTSNTPARPYMQPALENVKSKVPEIIEEIRQQLEKK